MGEGYDRIRLGVCDFEIGWSSFVRWRTDFWSSLSMYVRVELKKLMREVLVVGQ